MADDGSYSPEERYRIVDKLIEDVKLRRYFYQTGKSYISIVKDFISSGKTQWEFLLSYSNKSKSTMRSAYFALKFFHENVLNTKQLSINNLPKCETRWWHPTLVNSPIVSGLNAMEIRSQKPVTFDRTALPTQMAGQDTINALVGAGYIIKKMDAIVYIVSSFFERCQCFSENTTSFYFQISPIRVLVAFLMDSSDVFTGAQPSFLIFSIDSKKHGISPIHPCLPPL